jgi:hypothetical protein
MLKTRLTELVGCAVPIQQAPIGGLATPRLASAVAGAGGLGMVGGTGWPAAQLTERLDDLRAQTSGCFGVNFIVDLADPETIREGVHIAATRASVVDFFFGWPAPALVDIAHAGGAAVAWQVGSRDEALAAAAAGCDLIVAQGIEAGGHIRGRLGLLALLNQVLASVDVPVLAAGASGRAGRWRPRWRQEQRVCASAHALSSPKRPKRIPVYAHALIRARAEDTVFTEQFSGGWPTAPRAPLVPGGGHGLPGRCHRRESQSLGWVQNLSGTLPRQLFCE